MPDIDNTSSGDGQGDSTNQYVSKVISIADGRVRLELVEPQVAPNNPASEWPDPDLSVLRPNRRPPPTLPLDVLGDRWADWVKDAAAAAVAPADYVVAPLLAAASALIGNARWAQAWPGWKEPPHLWCAPVGDSGDGKSPGSDTINLYVLPFVERRMAADFPDQMRKAQTQIEEAKIRIDICKSDLRDAVKSGTALPPQPSPIPQEPLVPRLVLQDVTIERVASILASAAPKGVLMIRDELAGWLLGMNAYNDGARAFWLEAYGGRRYSVDRQKSSEPIIVPHLCVSWCGGTQPARVAEVLQGADDGLLARFMWFWPDPLPFERSRRPPCTDWAIAAFDRLRELDLATTEEGPTPLLVTLDDPAAERIVSFARAMQERREATTGLMRSAIGKARGLVLRLSLVLEYLRWCGENGYAAPPDTIKEDALIAAAKFVSEYVLPMAERTYGDTVCSEMDNNVTTLAKWIAKERPDAIHVRHLQRTIRLPGLVKADAIHGACKELIEAGWLGKPTAGTFQQRGSKVYPVSPRLMEALKQRSK
jgi:hypothetical protein